MAPGVNVCKLSVMECMIYTENTETEHKKNETRQLEESKVCPSSVELIRWVKVGDSVVCVAVTTRHRLLAAMAMHQK